MSASDSPPHPDMPARVRRDGWTAERQLRFLDTLAETRSVATAAAAAGMSRETAYRLRNRSEGSLFALLWGRAIALPVRPVEGHTSEPTNGQITRLLGTHFRRERGDFLNNARIAGGAR